MAGLTSTQLSNHSVLAQLRDMQSQMSHMSKQAAAKDDDKNAKSFTEHLREGVVEVNQMQNNADKLATDLASGKSDNIQETMVASTQAELSFNLMVQIRNKILEAYQEVMRMQV